MKKLLYSIGIIAIPYILVMNLNLDSVSSDSTKEQIVPVKKNNFGIVFNKNREEQGPDGRFRWEGNWYNTKYKEENEPILINDMEENNE